MVNKKDGESKFDRVILSIEKTVLVTDNLIETLEKAENAKNIDQSFYKNIIETGLELAHEIKDIPFSLREMKKILTDIVKSVHINRLDLEDSVNELLKPTGNQLTKVTNATEEATNNILGITDKIVEHENNLTTEITKLKECLKDQPEEIHQMIDSILEKVSITQTETFEIWNNLQFQDITTQQIEFAYNLLRETENKLVKVSDRLAGLDEIELDIIEEHDSAYDPNAEFRLDDERQKMIDDLFKSNNSSK